MLFDFSGVDVEVVANGQLPNTVNGDKQKQADDRAAMETKSKDDLRKTFSPKPNSTAPNTAIASGCDKPADIGWPAPLMTPAAKAKANADAAKAAVAASEDDDDLPGVSVDVLLANTVTLTDIPVGSPINTELVGEVPANESAEVAASEVVGDLLSAMSAGELLEQIDTLAEAGANVRHTNSPNPVEHVFYRPETSIERLARREHETEIQEAQAKLSDLVLRQREIEAELKAAKKEVKEAAAELEGLQKRGPSDKPLFNGVEMLNTQSTPPRDSSVDPQARPEIPAGESASVSVTENNTWESAKIEELKLASSLTEKLKETGIHTIGRLEKFRKAVSLGEEKWPRGIGEAKVSKLVDAIIDWLNKNRESYAVATPLADPAPVAEASPAKVAAEPAEVAAEAAEPAESASVAESVESEAADFDPPFSPTEEDVWGGKYPARVRTLIDISAEDIVGVIKKGESRDVAEVEPQKRGVCLLDEAGTIFGLEVGEFEVIAWTKTRPVHSPK